MAENPESDNEKGGNENKFDILSWWKINSIKFSILSQMARDVLAIPISTVTLESTFRTEGRVLDAFRSSLTPRIVESLLCTQDWLRGLALLDGVEESMEDLVKLEAGTISCKSIIFIINTFL